MSETCSDHSRCTRDIEIAKEKASATYDAVFGRNGHIGVAERVTRHDDRLDTIDIRKRDVDECTRLRSLDLRENKQDREQIIMEFEAKIDRVTETLEKVAKERERNEDQEITKRHLAIMILVPNTITVVAIVINTLLGA